MSIRIPQVVPGAPIAQLSLGELAPESPASDATGIPRGASTRVLRNWPGRQVRFSRSLLTTGLPHAAMVIPRLRRVSFHRSAEFPLLFLPPVHRYQRPQALTTNVLTKPRQELEAVLSAVFKRLTIAVYRGGEVQVVRYFDYLDQELGRALRDQDIVCRVLPSGGVVRSAIGYIYNELYKASLEEPPRTTQEVYAEMLHSTDDIPASSIRGNGSDFDLLVDCHAEHFTRVHTEIRRLTGSTSDYFDLRTTDIMALRQVANTVEDVRHYHDQIALATSQGGSTIDFLAFDVVTGRFVEPPGFTTIVDDLLSGQYAYVAPRDRSTLKNPIKQTVRGIRPLLELPFLKLKDETVFREELEQLLHQLQTDPDAIKSHADYEKALQQFQRIITNSRQSAGHNRLYRAKADSVEALILRVVEAFEALAKDILLPEFVDHFPLTGRVISATSLGPIPSAALIPPDDFIAQCTDNGFLYHGTHFVTGLAIMRGGLIATGGRKKFGSRDVRGGYSSASREVAETYARKMGGKGIVIPLRVKPDPRLRVLDLEIARKNAGFNACVDRMIKCGKDPYEYLARVYGIDIIKRGDHLILQNMAVVDYPENLSQLLPSFTAFAHDEQLAVEDRVVVYAEYYRYHRFLIAQGYTGHLDPTRDRELRRSVRRAVLAADNKDALLLKYPWDLTEEEDFDALAAVLFQPLPSLEEIEQAVEVASERFLADYPLLRYAQRRDGATPKDWLALEVGLIPDDAHFANLIELKKQAASVGARKKLIDGLVATSPELILARFPYLRGQIQLPTQIKMMKSSRVSDCVPGGMTRVLARCRSGDVTLIDQTFIEFFVEKGAVDYLAVIIGRGHPQVRNTVVGLIKTRGPQGTSLLAGIFFGAYRASSTFVAASPTTTDLDLAYREAAVLLREAVEGDPDWQALWRDQVFAEGGESLLSTTEAVCLPWDLTAGSSDVARIISLYPGETEYLDHGFDVADQSRRFDFMQKLLRVRLTEAARVMPPALVAQYRRWPHFLSEHDTRYPRLGACVVAWNSRDASQDPATSTEDVLSLDHVLAELSRLPLTPATAAVLGKFAQTGLRAARFAVARLFDSQAGDRHQASLSLWHELRQNNFVGAEMSAHLGLPSLKRRWRQRMSDLSRRRGVGAIRQSLYNLSDVPWDTSDVDDRAFLIQMADWLTQDAGTETLAMDSFDRLVLLDPELILPLYPDRRSSLFGYSLRFAVAADNVTVTVENPTQCHSAPFVTLVNGAVAKYIAGGELTATERKITDRLVASRNSSFYAAVLAVGPAHTKERLFAGLRGEEESDLVLVADLLISPLPGTREAVAERLNRCPSIRISLRRAIVRASSGDRTRFQFRQALEHFPWSLADEEDIRFLTSEIPPFEKVKERWDAVRQTVERRKEHTLHGTTLEMEYEKAEHNYKRAMTYIGIFRSLAMQDTPLYLARFAGTELAYAAFYMNDERRQLFDDWGDNPRETIVLPEWLSALMAYLDTHPIAGPAEEAADFIERLLYSTVPPLRTWATDRVLNFRDNDDPKALARYVYMSEEHLVDQGDAYTTMRDKFMAKLLITQPEVLLKFRLNLEYPEEREWFCQVVRRLGQPGFSLEAELYPIYRQQLRQCPGKLWPESEFGPTRQSLDTITPYFFDDPDLRTQAEAVFARHRLQVALEEFMFHAYAAQPRVFVSLGIPNTKVARGLYHITYEADAVVANFSWRHRHSRDRNTKPALDDLDLLIKKMRSDATAWDDSDWQMIDFYCDQIGYPFVRVALASNTTVRERVLEQWHEFPLEITASCLVPAATPSIEATARDHLLAYFATPGRGQETRRALISRWFAADDTQLDSYYFRYMPLEPQDPHDQELIQALVREEEKLNKSLSQTRARIFVEEGVDCLHEPSDAPVLVNPSLKRAWQAVKFRLGILRVVSPFANVSP